MVKTIPMISIQLENQFREDIEDLSLTLSIKIDGLQKPLIVEGPTVDNTYILVEGYRRFNSLQKLDFKEVDCILQDLTGQAKRVIKRLSNELHVKKKTGYELERMINYLLDSGYTVKQISNEANVTKKTIQKHIKSRNVNIELKNRAEKFGVGKDGLIRLVNLPNAANSVKQTLIDNYIEKDFFGYHIDSVERVARNEHFKDMLPNAQEKCLQDAIAQAKFSHNKAKRILYPEVLKHYYNEECHSYVFETICEEIEKMIGYCNENLVHNLSSKQRLRLHKLIETLARKTGMPEYWSQFPRDKSNNPKGKRPNVVNINR